MENLLCQFQDQLENLQKCDWCGIHPHIFLDREHYQVSAYIPDEVIRMRTDCVHTAENQFHEYYASACNAFTVYGDPYAADGFLTKFKCALTSRLAELQRLLDAYGKPEEINAIMDLLSPDAVCLRMAEINKSLVKRYMLPAESLYSPLIAYERCDPSEYESNLPAKLVAKLFTRHGYNLLDAIQKLEADASSILCQYKDAFEANAALEVERSIIIPIQKELGRLGEQVS